jgi:hypothetical protein
MLQLKTAVLLEWNRVFALRQTNRRLYWFSCTLIGLNIAGWSITIVTLMLGCIPLKKLWYFWIDGTCMDRRPRDITMAAFNVTMDIFILLLPQGIIWRLQLSKRRKWGLSAVFAVGLL